MYGGGKKDKTVFLTFSMSGTRRYGGVGRKSLDMIVGLNPLKKSPGQ